KRRLNAHVKATLKTLTKKFVLLVKAGELDNAKKLLPKISSALDKAAKRKIIHKGNASRTKSRLAKRLAA
ncbi:MAG: 30S ribosomal protein S20, partial [bacterium]